MRSVYVENPPDVHHAKPPVTRVDDKRGTFGMLLFITTEATLFLILFVSYYYVEKGQPQRWSLEEPPKLHYVLPMLAILLLSSVVLHWGEKQAKKENRGAALLGLYGTVLLGLAFLGLTYFDYAEHLRTLTPWSNAYGSIFYTITTLHGLHLVLGLLMLLWVSALPRWEPALRSPHRPYHNASMYWHFVDIMWVFIVALLYVAPHIYSSL